MKEGRLTVLAVDDNEDIRKQLRWGFSREPFEMLFAEDADEAIRLFRRHLPPVVMLDLGLPPHEESASEGFRCLRAMLDCAPLAKVIVITGNEDRGNAVKAVHEGAYDYYAKPIDLGELRTIVNRALHLQAIENESLQSQPHAPAEGEQFGLIGRHRKMQECLETIRKVARSDIPVLITGESGTGKELVARAIHKASLRSDGPMVAVNCGAIPENLLESEFFGHEKGAFTGANTRVRGKVEYASGGSLFLDEIGELPTSMQVKLLRFLQDRVFQRVGGREDLVADLRIVSATNQDLRRCLDDGSFRKDLFYRIGAVVIELPPLRERGEDVETLARVFMQRAAEEYGAKRLRFSGQALLALRSHNWPGNVRELENKVRRAVVLAQGRNIEPADLGLDGGGQVQANPLHSESVTLREAREWVERELVGNTLHRHGGNISKASKALGVSRPTLYDLLRKHNLEM